LHERRGQGGTRRQLRRGTGYGLYPTSGASDDYAFSRHFADPLRAKVYGFTIECGHSFQPTWAEAEEVIHEVSAGLIAFCLEVPCISQPLTVQLVTSKEILRPTMP
jgi:hypothetical protein